MFDVGWPEMAVIALIALVVMGPKELPKAMRSLAKWTGKARSMAREFQSGIDDMVREADLDDARKAIESAKSLDIGKVVEETIDPTGGLRDEAKEFKDEMAREDAGDDAGDSVGKDTGTPDDGEDVAEGKAEGATVIEHPLNIAPPDSVTPPPQPEATPPAQPKAATPAQPKAAPPAQPKAATPSKPEPEAATAGGDGSKQRA